MFKIENFEIFFSFMQFLFKGEMWISLVKETMEKLKLIIFESEKKTLSFTLLMK